MVIDWDQVDVRMVEAGKSRWPAGTRKDHTWKGLTIDHDLWLVWAGRGKMSLSVGEVDLVPGTCLWLRPGVNYKAEQDPDHPVGNYYVHFELLNPDKTVREYNQPIPPEVLHVRDIRFVRQLFRRITELAPMPGLSEASAARAALANQALRTLVMELDITQPGSVAAVQTGTKEYHRRTLIQIADEISRAPYAAPSVAELAARAGYSEDHFTRVFKAEFGVGPCQFRVRARIMYSARLLLSTTLRVHDVAARAGYNDVFLFNKQFKQVMNYTPTEYRKLGSIVANDRREQHRPFPRPRS